ncbi:hypothetical protein LXA43DRAFT_974127 [Ganoderma leucocontextum]|nr:hypothetical protein LXA43DRAFT_974127 [Ganoderma leucocontextum]
MSAPEPDWEPLAGTAAYTRPLLGSEASTDQMGLLQNGMSQVCMGVAFTTSLAPPELEVRLKEAVIRLRYTCPIVGATLRSGIHDPQLRSWVYTPLKDVHEARAWADQTVVSVLEPTEPHTFLASKIETNLSYKLVDGVSQFIRIYLIRTDITHNTFGIFFHGVHAIMDARASLKASSLLLEWMSDPKIGSVADLQWGKEFANLPPGPITATGGPREDWQTHGTALLMKVGAHFANETPSHSLNPGSSDITVPGKLHRYMMTFTAEETAKMTQTLKRLGYTFTHLMDAATALATFELNPVSEDAADKAHVAYDLSTISLSDRLPPSLDSRRHFVSCLATLPVDIVWKPLVSLAPGKARLLGAMAQSKAQYDEYLANPCMPHLTSELARIAPLREIPPPRSPYAPSPVNFGLVERFLPTTWPKEGASVGPPLFRVDAMHIGHRFLWPMLYVACVL